eukprot:Partr_v1_DN28933_c0_g1_i1_m26007 putative Inherit from NOG: VSP with INR
MQISRLLIAVIAVANRIEAASRDRLVYSTSVGGGPGDQTGNRIYSKNNANQLVKWNIDTFTVDRYLTGHSDVVNAITVQSGRVYSASNDNTMRIWSDSDGSSINTVAHSNDVMGVCGDGSYVYTIVRDSTTVFRWSLTGGASAQFTGGHTSFPLAIVCANGFIYTTGTDQSIVVWNQNGNVLQTISNAHSNWIPEMAADTLGATGIIVTSSDQAVSKSWTIASDGRLSLRNTMNHHTAGVWSSGACYGHFYQGLNDGRIEQFRLSDGAWMGEMNGHNGNAINMLMCNYGFMYSGSAADSGGSTARWDMPETCPANAVCGSSGYTCSSGFTDNGRGSCTNLVCPAGSYKTSSTTCTQCPAGQISGNGATSCSVCPAGTFESGRTSCNSCPTGTVSSGGASGSCTTCSAGTYKSSISTCSACSDGYYSGAGASICTICSAGFYESGKTACLPCASGSVSSAGSTSCTACTAGTFTASASSCSACAAGSISGPSATSCSPCAAGTYESLRTSCQACTAGTFSGPRASSCSPCSAGTISGSSAASCTDCGAGTYEVSRIECRSCLSGYVSGAKASSCSACGPGTYKSSASACSSCPIGQISTGTANTACTACGTGTFANSGVSCDDCAAGTFASGPANSCTPCPIGQFNSVPKSTGCTQCQPGTFKGASGAGLCLNCNAGASSTLGSGTCFNCPAGTFKSNVGVGTCQNCPAGNFASGTGNLECQSCASGTFQPAIGQASCSSCSLGISYQPAAGSLSCINCPSNSQCNSLTSYTCLSTFADAGNGTCLKCQDGQFYSNGACRGCPTFASCTASSFSCQLPYVDNGSYDCVIPGCQAGQTLNGANECVDCPLGTSKSEIGNGPCTPCASGTFQNEAGKASCKPCPQNALRCSAMSVTCPQDYSLLSDLCKRSNLAPEQSISGQKDSAGEASDLMIYAIGAACVALVVSGSLYVAHRIRNKRLNIKSSMTLTDMNRFEPLNSGNNINLATTMTSTTIAREAGLGNEKTAFSSKTARFGTSTVAGTTYVENALAIPGYMQFTALDFVEEKFLSEGGFGSVHIAKAGHDGLRTFGDRIVIKKMSRTANQLMVDSFHQELSIMCYLIDSKYIAKLLGYCEQPMIIIMKYYQNGALGDWIRKDKLKNRRMQVSFISDIAKGLMAIHAAGLAHCDMKPGNVLIDRDIKSGRYFCVITDFGIAQIVEKSMAVVSGFHVSNINAASVAYAPPEILNHMRTRNESMFMPLKLADIYSYTIVMFEVLSRRRAWPKDERQNDMTLHTRMVTPPVPPKRAATTTSNRTMMMG